MRVLFLDIDGVLNNHTTRERVTGFIGVDAKLRDLYLKWLANHNISVVLSSTWRLYSDMCKGLEENGITFLDKTPYIPKGPRGAEIQAWLDKNGKEVVKYAILDDNTDFYPEQLGNFIQTNPKLGVTEERLLQIEHVLGLYNPYNHYYGFNRPID